MLWIASYPRPILEQLACEIVRAAFTFSKYPAPILIAYFSFACTIRTTKSEFHRPSLESTIQNEQFPLQRCAVWTPLQRCALLEPIALQPVLHWTQFCWKKMAWACIPDRGAGMEYRRIPSHFEPWLRSRWNVQSRLLCFLSHYNAHSICIHCKAVDYRINHTVFMKL